MLRTVPLGCLCMPRTCARTGRAWSVPTIAPCESDVLAATQAIWAYGTQFWQGPREPFYFVGANNFNLIDASAYSEASVYNLLVTHWNNGVRASVA